MWKSNVGHAARYNCCSLSMRLRVEPDEFRFRGDLVPPLEELSP